MYPDFVESFVEELRDTMARKTLFTGMSRCARWGDTGSANSRHCVWRNRTGPQRRDFQTLTSPAPGAGPFHLRSSWEYNHAASLALYCNSTITVVFAGLLLSTTIEAFLVLRRREGVETPPAHFADSRYSTPMAQRCTRRQQPWHGQLSLRGCATPNARALCLSQRHAERRLHKVESIRKGHRRTISVAKTLMA